jgi:cell wall-associated NlpC family hydrolase
MTLRTSPSLRIALALAVGCIAGPLAGMATAAPSLPPTPIVQAAQAQVLATQDLIDAASSQLAAVRSELFTATDPSTITSLDVQQSRLQVQKTRLIARLTVQQRRLTRLIAQQARADAARAAALQLTASTAPPLLNAIANERLPAPGPTATAIDSFLGTRRSPLTGLGAVFVADGEAAGVDPRFIVAISGAETSFGTYGPAQTIHNPFGLGPQIIFPNWSAAIAAAASTLGGSLYRGAGLVTIPSIQSRWAPLGVANDPGGLNSNWQTNVSTYFAALGGNPNGPVMAPASNTLVSLTPTTPAVGTTGPAAARTALTLLGVPNPADSPNGLNDAQLVQTVYQDQGVSLPGTLSGLASAGVKVSDPLHLVPGDAVFFHGPSGAIVHVGLYLGAGEFIHAPGPGQRVQIASMYRSPWRTSFATARRY